MGPTASRTKINGIKIKLFLNKDCISFYLISIISQQIQDYLKNHQPAFDKVDYSLLIYVYPK